jgi:tetratricopeptide (TPR) repeat protein
MGSVWLAEQIDGRLTRRLALKLPLPGLAQGDWRRRFERERDILAGLDHPGIAKLFDAGVSVDGRPYLAMQFVAGESLIRYAANHGLSVSERLRLFTELLAAVQHAHAALVVHRDLKPSNILVDEQGRVMLLDFGIAKLLGDHKARPVSDLTEFAAPALTLDYASPEQIMGTAIGTGTDIYSLGVVLYELLTGQLPYRLRRVSRAELEQAVLEQELAPPSARAFQAHAKSMGLGPRALGRELRGDLDAIVLKSLRKQSEQRYATAQAFAEDLNHWLRKEPVSARPDAFGYRARRMLSRNWKLVGLGATVSLALIVSTAVALAQAREARQATELARRQARQAEVVTGFMQDLFLNNSVRQVDPKAARKRTAEQLIDDAASRIGVALADAPEQQIALLHKMAHTYYEMRLPDRAIAISRQAADLAGRVFGPDHPRTKIEQASWLSFSIAGGHGQAVDDQLQPLVNSLPLLVMSGNEEDRQLALDLCDALMNQEFEMFPESALRYAELAERVLPQVTKRDSALAHHHMMGVVYLQNLRLADATRHFDIARRLQAAQGFAAGDADSYPTWQGRLQEVAGHFDEAESLMREGYAMERHNDAGGSRVSDWCLANYSRFLVDTGRAVEGLAIIQTGGPLADAAIRSQLPTSMRSLLAQAHALAHLGRAEEALAKAENAERMLAELESEASRPPLPVVTETLLVLGRLDKAIAKLDREEPSLAKGRSSIAARALSEYRIRALIALGRPSAAREYLESHRMILSPPGGGPAEHARLAWLEGGVALKEGRLAEARRVLEEGLSRIGRAGPGAQIYLREWVARLQDRMGDAKLASDDAEGARTSYEAAMQAYEKVVDPRYSMALGRVVRQLADLAWQRGDVVSARRMRSRADAIVARHPEQRGWGA